MMLAFFYLTDPHPNPLPSKDGRGSSFGPWLKARFVYVLRQFSEIRTSGGQFSFSLGEKAGMREASSVRMRSEPGFDDAGLGGGGLDQVELFQILLAGHFYLAEFVGVIISEQEM